MGHLHIGQPMLLFFFSSSFLPHEFTLGFGSTVWEKWIPANVASLSCQIFCGPHLQKYSSYFEKLFLSEEVRSIYPKGCFGPQVSSIQTLL